MNQSIIKAGSIVSHPAKPEWGPGKVLVATATRLRVFFRDIQDDHDGPAEKEFVVGRNPLVLAGEQSDPVLDGIRWNSAKGEVTSSRKVAGGRKRGSSGRRPDSDWTHAHAIEEFLKLFPRGFDDPYQHEQERDYKWAAHELFRADLGNGQSRQLLEQGQVGEVVERLLRVESKINLLFPNEKMALHDGLKDESAASAFIAALLDLLEGPGLDEIRFLALASAARDLPADKGKSDPDKWPVVTVFPFIAEPDQFMFLKPEVTNLAADRLGFNLQYQSRPNWITYMRLHEMARTLLQELREYGARDFIDVQTFIWVTGTLEKDTY